MKIFLDVTILVELGRKNLEAVGLVEALVRNNEELLVSTVSVSEVLEGSYFSKDFRAALDEAKQVLSQFSWTSLDAEIAEKIAQYWAYLLVDGRAVEYQDVAVAATFAATKSDFLLTQNKKCFEAFPEVGSKARTISEFSKIYR